MRIKIIVNAVLVFIGFFFYTNSSFSQEEICDDGIDNDLDLLTDCADSDCLDPPCDIAFACSNQLFLVINGNLKVWDMTDWVDVPGFTNSTYQLNAIGYNVQDGFIYGIDRGSGNLIQVTRQGTIDLGPVSSSEGIGTSLPSNNFPIGDMDLCGSLYVTQKNLTEIYKINVSQRTYSNINITGITGSFQLTDWVFHPITGKLYGMVTSSNVLRVFNIDGSWEEDITVTGNISCYAEFGAMYADSEGKIYAFCNSGKLFELNPNNDYSEFISNEIWEDNNFASANNDGASCSFWDRTISTVELDSLLWDCCPTNLFEIDTSCCYGDEIIIGDETYNSPGHYEQEFINIIGCDSLVSIDIILSGYGEDVSIDTFICDGDILFLGTEVYIQPGNYIQFLTNDSGCDSTVFISIEQSGEVDEIWIDTTVCEGNIVFVGDEVYGTPGVYYQFFNNAASCDSIVEIRVSWYPEQMNQIDRTICEGDTIYFGGEMIYQAAVYTSSFSDIHGCDSIVDLSLSVNPSYSEIHIKAEICDGQTYNFSGIDITEPGEYSDTVVLATDCDSITTLILKVLPHYEKQIDTIICEGSIVIFGNQILEEIGEYYENYNSIDNCDSTVRLNLEVIPLEIEEFDYKICSGDTLIIGNEFYFQEGTFDRVYPGSKCDSIVRRKISFLDESDPSCLQLLESEFNFFIPNAFTPNGDGINDFFNIYHSHQIECEIVEMEIYDRWGSRIVANRNVQTNNSYSGWDGRVGNEYAQNGVYVYYLKILCNDGFIKDFYGDLCLLR